MLDHLNTIAAAFCFLAALYFVWEGEDTLAAVMVILLLFNIMILFTV